MYKIHTYISLIFCIPLVIVCFTGSVLVYKDEINNILMPGVIYVVKNSDKNEQKSRLKFDELREKIEKEYPHHEIVGWNIDADSQKTDKIGLLKHGAGEKEWACVYLDAFSGEIKSDLVLLLFRSAALLFTETFGQICCVFGLRAWLLL